MQSTLCNAQNEDGSWAGQHCITGRTFCTSSALLTLLVDRTSTATTSRVETNKDEEESCLPPQGRQTGEK